MFRFRTMAGFPVWFSTLSIHHHSTKNQNKCKGCSTINNDNKKKNFPKINHHLQKQPTDNKRITKILCLSYKRWRWLHWYPETMPHVWTMPYSPAHQCIIVNFIIVRWGIQKNMTALLTSKYNGSNTSSPEWRQWCSYCNI